MKRRLTLLALLVVLGMILFCACAYNTEDIPTSDTEKAPQISTDSIIESDESIIDSEKKDDTIDSNDPDDSKGLDRNLEIEQMCEIIHAGEYYGNDFDNLTNDSSYFRIIETYDEFVSLTEKGKDFEKEMFNDSLVLALYTDAEQDSAAEIFYGDFVVEAKTQKVCIDRVKQIYESSRVFTEEQLEDLLGIKRDNLDASSQSNGEISKSQNEEKNDVKEIVYLLIPKASLAENMEKSGEIYIHRILVTLE